MAERRELTRLRVLVIEDQAFQRAELLEFLRSDGIEGSFYEVGALVPALAAIDDYDYDIVVCDMHIPSDDDAADHSTNFGKEAYRYSLKTQPGAIRIFYSAFIDLDMIGADLTASPVDDLFGEHSDRGLTRHVQKGPGALDSCLSVFREVRDGLDGLQTIDVVSIGTSDPLDELEIRALQVFARRSGGSSIVVEHLAGLSGSRALRVVVRDDREREVCRAFSKIGPQDALAEERRRYERFVVNRLPYGSYANLTDEVQSLVGRRRGLFYALAEEFDRSVLTLLADHDTECAEVVNRLRDVTQLWQPEDGKFMIGDLRRSVVDDRLLEPYLEQQGLQAMAAEVEARTCSSPVGLQHGDLHGENILVDRSFRPLLVDFADVGRRPLGTDPLTLETCLLFHPLSPFSGTGWPTDSQLASWADLSTYLADCPAPEFVSRCRDWSLAVCGGYVALGGLLWAHAARQVKYGVFPQDRNAILMRAAAGLVLSQT
jgi:CheY-like chemotaxis protein